MWTTLGLYKTFLIFNNYLIFQLNRFRLLLWLQEVQRLLFECEDPRGCLQLHAFHQDGLDQVELSWPAEARISFVA